MGPTKISIGKKQGKEWPKYPLFYLVNKEICSKKLIILYVTYLLCYFEFFLFLIPWFRGWKSKNFIFTLFLYLYPRSNITQTILNLEGSTLTCFRKEGYIWVKMRAKSGLKWNNCAIRKYSIIICRRGAIKLPNIITAGCKSIASQGFIHLLKFTNEAYLEYYVMSIVWSIFLLKIG